LFISLCFIFSCYETEQIEVILPPVYVWINYRRADWGRVCFNWKKSQCSKTKKVTY